MRPVKYYAAFLIILLTSVSLFISACGNPAPKGEGFAIYLTRDDIPPSQMEALSHVELADQSIIGTNDIISYNLTFPKSEFRSLFSLKKDVFGTLIGIK
jgi:hypothetical protein